MPIQQISTSNTFAQWLTATQALIENQNYFEQNSEIVANTANNIFDTYSNTVNVFINTTSVYNNTLNVFISANSVFGNTVNVYNNTITVYTDTVNTYNDIRSYVSSAYDTANTVQTLSQQAYDTANLALAAANAATSNVVAALAYERANDAFDLASRANTHAQAAFNRANTVNVFTQSAFNQANSAGTLAQSAFDKANAGGGNVFSVIAVDGQDPINATSNNTTLNLVAGDNITITTDAGANSITINSTGGGSLGGAQSTAAIADTLALRDTRADLYANNFYSTSDQNLKENIRTIENAVNTVIELRGVRFNWKGSSVDQLGMIAQEVEQILPEVVSETETKSVNYAVIVSVLIEAIKELNERIKVLENR